MGLLAAGAGADLPLGRKRADVVADHVALAVVDVEALRRAAVYQIVLYQHAGGALVQINAPAAVAALARVRRHVVDHVARKHGAGLEAEGIDAAHIRKPALPDVVDQVIRDFYILRQVVAVAPVPPAGDGSVIAVGDLVMRYFRAVAVGEVHADSAEEFTPVALDQVVRYGDIRNGVGFLGKAVGAAHEYGGGCDIAEQAVFHPAVPHAVLKLYPVRAEVQKFAVCKRRVFGVPYGHRALHVSGGLRRVDIVFAAPVIGPPGSRRGDIPIRFGKTDALEPEPGNPVDIHKAFQRRPAQHAAVGGFVLFGHVIERIGSGIQIPLAGLVQRLKHVFKIIAVDIPDPHRGGARKPQLARGAVDAGEIHELIVPVVQNPHLYVGGVGEIYSQVRRIGVKGALPQRHAPGGILFRPQVFLRAQAVYREVPRFGVTRHAELRAVFEQRFEPLRIGVGQPFCEYPHAVYGIFRKSRDLPCAREHRLPVARSGPGHVGQVRFGKAQRFGKFIYARQQPHVNARFFGRRALQGFQLLFRCSHGFQRGVLRARGGVVPGGG